LTARERDSDKEKEGQRERERERERERVAYVYLLLAHETVAVCCTVKAPFQVRDDGFVNDVFLRQPHFRWKLVAPVVEKGDVASARFYSRRIENIFPARPTSRDLGLKFTTPPAVFPVFFQN